MMDVRYKRDLNSNYMIMTDAEGREETYEDRMITENRIYGFLPCVEQKKEKQTEYFYSFISSGCIGLLRQWAANDFRDSATSIAVMAQNLMLGAAKALQMPMKWT